MLLKIIIISFLLACQQANISINEKKYSIEIADTDSKRQNGLMYRKTLSQNRGMLFIFDKTEEHSFWMKNTQIPLDIIFLDENKKIVGVIENAKILSEEKLTIGSPSKYVLELNSGEFKKNNFKIGDLVVF